MLFFPPQMKYSSLLSKIHCLHRLVWLTHLRPFDALSVFKRVVSSWIPTTPENSRKVRSNTLQVFADVVSASKDPVSQRLPPIGRNQTASNNRRFCPEYCSDFQDPGHQGITIIYGEKNNISGDNGESIHSFLKDISS